MNKAQIKEIESRLGDLMKKHQLDVGGEPLTPEVYCVTTHTKHRVLFNDENTAYLFSGNVSAVIHDEYEKIIDDLGYTIDDRSEGNVLYLKEKSVPRYKMKSPIKLSYEPRSMFYWPGMIDNYVRAREINDTTFIKFFEGMWEPEILERIKDSLESGNWEVTEDKDVIFRD